MKLLVVITLLVGLVASEEYCYDNTVDKCSGKAAVDDLCNAVYGGIELAQPILNDFLRSKLTASYDYLLLGTHFGTYQKNRPGFEKLIKDLSDEAFDEAIDLIKHISKRGGVPQIGRQILRDEKPVAIETIQITPHVTKGLDELHALSFVLDSEKRLSTEVIHAHKRVSHANEQKHYDPEISQFLEERFLEHQADTVRKFSGHVNDLTKFMDSNKSGTEPSLSIYLFDEYLQKA